MRAFFGVFGLFVLVSCVHEREEVQSFEREFEIIEDNRLYSFILPERCLDSYKHWISEQNKDQLTFTSKAYELSPGAIYRKKRYNVLVKSNKVRFTELYDKVSGYVQDTCYGSHYREIDAESVMFRDQVLANMYQLGLKFTEIKVEGDKILFFYNDKQLREELNKIRRK